MIAAVGVGFTSGCQLADEGSAAEACPEVPRCEGNTLVACGDGGVTRSDCAEARCAADAPVPRCVPAEALPCEAGAPAVRCENGRIVDCDPEAGYYLTRACPSGTFCAGEEEPRCVDPSGLRCTPDLWAPLCVAGERFECLAERIVVAPADCP